MGLDDRIYLPPTDPWGFAIDFQLIPFRILKLDAFGNAMIDRPDNRPGGYAVGKAQPRWKTIAAAVLYRQLQKKTRCAAALR
jgi:hypothetical protein